MATLLLICFVTLRPGSETGPTAFRWCLACGMFGTQDFVLNVALFMPLGIAIALGRAASRRRVLAALIAAALLSTLIELAQLWVVPGRDPSASDLLANSLGGMLGGFATIAIPTLRRLTVRTWRVVAWAFAVASAACLVFGDWAMDRPIPYTRIYAQYQPIRPNYEPFVGKLLSLALSGVDLAPSQSLAPDAFPRAMFGGDFDATATVVTAAPSRRTALIARATFTPHELVMLGQRGDAFVVRYLTNAQRAGLRTPLHALRGALPAHDSVRLQFVAAGASIALRVAAPRQARSLELHVGAARLWATFLPWDYAFGREATAADALWLALLFAPAAYAGARGSRRLDGVLPVVCLFTYAVVTQSALRSWPLVSGMLFAVVVGCVLGWRAQLPNEYRSGDSPERL